MTWLVNLRGRDASGARYDHEVRIFSNDWESLFENAEYRWDMLLTLLQQGQLERVMIDFRPTGIPRIEKDGFDGLYYLTIDHIRVGKGHEKRGDAWASREAYK